VVDPPVFPESQQELPVQPRWSSSPPVRLAACGDSLVFCLQGFLLEECPACLDTLNQSPEQAEGHPPEVHGGIVAGPPQ